MIEIKSPAKKIESENPKVEHAYIKFPGKELILVGINMREKGVTWDYEKIRKHWEASKRKKYSEIHTHQYDKSSDIFSEVNDAGPLPSPNDLQHFLTDDEAKSMFIAQQDIKSGHVGGYFVLRKTRNTKPVGYSHTHNAGDESPKKNIWQSVKDKLELFLMTNGLLKSSPEFKYALKIKHDAKKYGFVAHTAMAYDKPELLVNAIKDFAHDYHLHYKFIPAKEHYLDLQGTKFVESRRKSSLEEKVVVIITMIGLLGSIFVLSPYFTGNVINNHRDLASGWIGGVLFVIGLIGMWRYFKNKQ
ncbi:MAG: hypothetical protein AABX07_03735 [Nanoarchaeota archaeon]